MFNVNDVKNGITFVLDGEIFTVLEFSHVTKSYGEKVIFEDLSFEVHKGDRIAILGDNGTGKTTILEIMKDKIKDIDENIFDN